jgi:hypothetical protein
MLPKTSRNICIIQNVSRNAQTNQTVKSQHVFEDISAPQTRINLSSAVLSIIKLNLKTKRLT